jgi:hypothetical protein
MELTPYIGKEPVRSEAFSIVVSEADLARVTKMVGECSAVMVVGNKKSFDAAATIVGRLKTLINEIEAAKKTAKRPFVAVEQAIQNKAAQVSADLLTEYSRLGGLLDSYAAQVEAQARAEAREREAKRRAEIARLEQIAAEARAAQAKAEAEAKAAKNEAERLRALEHAKDMEATRLDAELDRELASEIANLGNKKPVSLVTGGRIDHPWKFRLVDVKAAVEGGYWRCLRWEPDILACRDEVKAQLERKDPDAQPHIPGFEISRETSVSVRASA